MERSKKKETQKWFYGFALAVVRLVRSLPRDTVAVELGRPLLKSGTSIAANYEEALAGFSKADFIHKLSISFKEAKESLLWIRLLRDSGVVVQEKQGPLEKLLHEGVVISRILAKSPVTSKANLAAGK